MSQTCGQIHSRYYLRVSRNGSVCGVPIVPKDGIDCTGVYLRRTIDDDTMIQIWVLNEDGLGPTSTAVFASFDETNEAYSNVYN